MSVPYAEVIGDPIAQSKSPVIHRFWLDRLGIAGDYRKCHVRPGDLADYFATRRADPDWRGCNVTIPHKQAVQQFLDRLENPARAIGAVNTIWRGDDGELTGTNTDVDGVAAALSGAPDPDKQKKAAIVIGAGGAARAAFACLAERGWRATVLARSPDKAAMAVAECGLSADVVAMEDAAQALRDASMLINATQLGMAGQQDMPARLLDGLSGMASDALVFDMIYAPLRTVLLERARSGGLATSDGLTMLIGQAATAFERFFGKAPDRRSDSELRAVLTA